MARLSRSSLPHTADLVQFRRGHTVPPLPLLAPIVLVHSVG